MTMSYLKEDMRKLVPIGCLSSIGIGALTTWFGVSYQKVSFGIIGSLIFVGTSSWIANRTIFTKKTSLGSFICCGITVFGPTTALGFLIGMPIFYAGKYGITNVILKK